MPNKRNKYLGNGGKRLVKQLFIEWTNIGEYDLALYSFHREDRTIDGKLYPSLYKLYMATKDITEARFVSEYLYDWSQWNAIAKTVAFKDEIARWREELKAKVMGELVDKLIEDGLSNSRSSKSSAKFLVEKLSKRSAGKPATAVIPTSEEEASIIATEIADDMKRLKLVRNDE